MGQLIFWFFPVVLLGISGWIGFVAGTFLLGKRYAQELTLRNSAVTLAIGVPIIAAIATLLPQAEMYSFLGEFMNYFWIWTAIAFAIGLLSGLRLARLSET